MARNVLWTAQRHGQDWDDPYVMTALEWMTSFVASADWTRRIAQTESFCETAKASWTSGVRVPLYDPADGIAWYAHQANTYGNHHFRSELFEPEAYRIAPLFRRIGMVLEDLKTVGGVNERVARLMSDGRMQPDDGFYELLVAAAYSRRGWDVSFVPEMPGLRKQQDLIVESQDQAGRWNANAPVARSTRERNVMLGIGSPMPSTPCRFERTDPCRSWRCSRTRLRTSIHRTWKKRRFDSCVGLEATVGMTKGALASSATSNGNAFGKFSVSTT